VSNRLSCNQAPFHRMSILVNQVRRTDRLDKLGVTGSSPVPPIKESPAEARVLLASRFDAQVGASGVGRQGLQLTVGLT
jgi:hypothetical protein